MRYQLLSYNASLLLIALPVVYAIMENSGIRAADMAIVENKPAKKVSAYSSSKEATASP